MGHARTTRAGRRVRHLLGLTTVGFALATVGAGAYSLAIFTSTAASGSNAFTVGSVTLGASPATALITLSSMLPGDSTTGTLTVSNSGTAQLRYAMTTSTTNTDSKALNGQLSLVVKTKDTNTSGCTNFNGTQLYSGTLSAAAIGDPTTGNQTGDRTLAGAGSEVLCFQATLPSTTGNGFQGATTTATFTFAAEQTTNNP